VRSADILNSYPVNLLSKSIGIDAYNMNRGLVDSTRVGAFAQGVGELAFPMMSRKFIRKMVLSQDSEGSEKSIIFNGIVGQLSDLASLVWSGIATYNTYRMTGDEALSISAGIGTKVGWNMCIHAGLDFRKKALRWLSEQEAKLDS
jgi:hypothetical protein